MSNLFNKDALQGRMLFAIPKKGRLYEKCLELLAGADIQFKRQNRLDVALVQNHPMALVFLPAADIPRFVGEGNVDLGITGQDMVAESGLSDLVGERLPLGFGKCSLQVQVPDASTSLQSPEDLVGKKVATSFDVLAKTYFEKLDATVNEKRRQELGVEQLSAEQTLKTQIEYVGGSVEAACALGVADGIGEFKRHVVDPYDEVEAEEAMEGMVFDAWAQMDRSDTTSSSLDLVESGETMRACGLHDISTLLTSQAVLITPMTPHERSDQALINKIISRINGVMTAARYVLCQYNVEKKNLDEALKITPGRRAATVSPLEDEKWVAVSAMVRNNDKAEVMDQLEMVGATDIFTMALDNCRT